MVTRTHLSGKPGPIILREVAASNSAARDAYKPKGFWYEVDGDWRRWCEAESFGCGSYLHTVELNDCNVLLVDSLGKLDDFHHEFKLIKKLSPSYDHIEIDWKRVSEVYDGLEIAPYQWERRFYKDFMWYYGWDCASGVIWRPKNATVTYKGTWTSENV